ncbi:putative transposase [Streptomyces sp. PVA_94-07]|nr:putative transposase [Streptomyces sp. PVA_94-07]
MIRRHELSDIEWEFVRPLLPESSRGRKRLDDRRVLNGIVWKFRTGTAWRDVPERYGPWATLHTRFRRWAADGTFDRMLRAAQAKADAAGDIEWLVSVDSTVVRAHQHAAGARKGAPRPRPRPVQRRSDQQNPPVLRWSGPPARLRRHGRQHQRLHPVHRRDGGDPGAPDRTRPSPPSARSRPGRQGLQLQGDPHLAPPPGHSAHDSRTDRPGPQPGPAGQPRRPPAGLRPRALQAPQRRGTVLQPPEAVARHRHPLRQDRPVLRSRRHPRLTPDVGVAFDDRT